MKNAILRALLAILPVALPTLAGADYLYSAVPPELMPRVLLVIDNSGSMKTEVGKTKKSRLQVVKETIDELIPTLEGVELGLVAFADGKSEYNSKSSCGAKQIESLGANRATLRETVMKLTADYNTPIDKSLQVAREVLQKAAAADDASSCRKYFVIFLSDGEENCGGDPVKRTAELRNVTVNHLDGTTTKLDIKTFVIGFGEDIAGSATLDKMARAGGTAVDEKGEIVCRDGQTCTQGVALSALTRTELKYALRRALEQVLEGEFSSTVPMIGSVPTRPTEVDRVARNFMVYPSFRMPGRQGHLYGIRLYEETEEWANAWEYTDLTKLDLNNCAFDYDTGTNPIDPDNPCIYDAGRMLTERVKTGATARKIYTGEMGTFVVKEGGATLPIASEPLQVGVEEGASLRKVYEAIASNTRFVAGLAKLPNWAAATEVADGRTVKELLTKPKDDDFVALSRWLHGLDPEDGKTGRNWDLGDIYHSSPAIVEAPPQPYTDRGYPRFRAALQSRPQMVYVGANDGMIHAFHAGPDVHYKWLGLDAPRWQPGEEAWAYLPVNMLVRTLIAARQGEERVSSMDLSCRVDDVQIDTSYTDENCNPDEDEDDDPWCGWRTVLVCGEGWGGNWYVALDVSDPSKPRPMWEFTSDGPGGLGRTWSVPSVALVNIAGKPTWLGLFGNGYNSDSGDCYVAEGSPDDGGDGGTGGTGGSGGSGGSGGTGGAGGSSGGGWGFDPIDDNRGGKRWCRCEPQSIFGAKTWKCQWHDQYAQQYDEPKCLVATSSGRGNNREWNGTACYVLCGGVTAAEYESGGKSGGDGGGDDEGGGTGGAGGDGGGDVEQPEDGGIPIPPANPLGCSGNKVAYHWLNLPYDGDFSEHGNGTQGDTGAVWAIDLATGYAMKRIVAAELGDVVANIPVIDVDFDNLADVAFVGGWNGELARLVLAKKEADSTETSPSNWSICHGEKTFTKMAVNQPITSRPSAFADPYYPKNVFIFVGAGVDRGLHRDEAGHEGGVWEFRAFYVPDDGSPECAPTFPAGNLCASEEDGEVWRMASLARPDSEARLIGAPVVNQLGNESRRVYYTTWDPPEAGNVCGEGITSVACMRLDRTELNPTDFHCLPCGDMDGDGESDPIVEVETGRSKPTTPAVADGQVYVVTDDGPMRLGNQDGSEPGEGGTPGQHAPVVETVSWRETF